MKMKYARFLAAALVLVVWSCGGSSSGGDKPAEDTQVTDTNTGTDVPAPITCDATRRPVVMAHGFLAAGDSYANHVMRFEANGYCLNRLFVFDWNTLDQDLDSASLLDAFVDEVLTQTGAESVDLMGHSAGGGLGYSYLSDATRAAKVANYVHIGSYKQDAPAGPNGEVATLNLWSEADVIITEKGDITGATNVKLTDEDHYAVATSAASFDAIYRFLNDDEAPKTTDIQPDAVRQVSGKVVVLGDNQIVSGTTVQVFVLDGVGARTSAEPNHSYVIDDSGRWGPFEAGENTYYELTARAPGDDALNVHHYFEPFIRSNPNVYLRLMPTTGLASMLMTSIPRPDDAANVIVFNSSGAMLAGRDSLLYDGNELITDDIASAETCLLALFLYDGDEDKQSAYTSHAIFTVIPFLRGLDVFIPATELGTVSLTLNNRSVHVRTWPATDGPVIVVFN